VQDGPGVLKQVPFISAVEHEAFAEVGQFQQEGQGAPGVRRLLGDVHPLREAWVRGEPGCAGGETRLGIVAPGHRCPHRVVLPGGGRRVGEVELFAVVEDRASGQEVLQDPQGAPHGGVGHAGGQARKVVGPLEGAHPSCTAAGHFDLHELQEVVGTGDHSHLGEGLEPREVEHRLAAGGPGAIQP
jgi:hypothetical protein